MKGVYAGYLNLGQKGLVRMAASTTNRRILAYSYKALTIVLATLAALAALYIQGDVLLLVIAMIILLIILLGLRNYLPRYLQESKLLLNIGAVRERERVIYKDLPWMVRSLGVYSRLYNPALDGLMRLPLSEMLHLVSRPYREDEPWFPTNTGDWVMMANGAIGQVLRQTPETVQLKTKGAVLTYATSSFLAGAPRNLSEGFGVSTVFGIDYKHQAISTTQVPNILHEAIKHGLANTDFGKYVEDVLVEFKEAAASSLNYQIYVIMKGEGAEYYFAISRVVQRLCVDICNAQGWGIPFNQLTVNAGSGFIAAPGI
jgi:small-conductance mechanosensitive channel